MEEVPVVVALGIDVDLSRDERLGRLAPAKVCCREERCPATSAPLREINSFVDKFAVGCSQMALGLLEPAGKPASACLGV